MRALLKRQGESYDFPIVSPQADTAAGSVDLLVRGVSRGPAIRRRTPRATADITGAATPAHRRIDFYESMCRMTRASDVFSSDRH